MATIHQHVDVRAEGWSDGDPFTIGWEPTERLSEVDRSPALPIAAQPTRGDVERSVYITNC